MEHLFIARQPIYDQYLGVIGYELLYRSGDMEVAVFDDGNMASCDTIINTFMHIGLEHLVGSSLAFINLPQSFVINQALTPMFKQQTVLEILEDIEPTEDVIQGLRTLKSEGYRLALDDFIFNEKLQPFVELADYIKIDVNDKSADQIQAQLDHIKAFKGIIIAEKVETQELYFRCVDLGFKYFQGFFFCRPQLFKQKHIPANKMVVLNLLNKLQDTELDYTEFESIMAQDVSLTYKLLRYINSATFALRREVESIKDAVVILGIDSLKNWISLILMSKIIDSKPNELIVTAMVRAKMCELIAEKNRPSIKPQMFIIGLFSILDALMDRPLIDLLDNINLRTEIKLALLDQSGEHGEILKQVLLYEHIQWNELESMGADTEHLAELYLESLLWADNNIKVLAR